MNNTKMKERLQEAILNTTKELDKENKWKETFDKRANEILKDKEIKEELSKKFHKAEPFTYYETINAIKNASTSLKVSVRYLGQEVAEIVVLANTKDNKNVTISTKKFDKNNEENFDCKIKLDNVSWRYDKKAREFRKYFKEREKIRTDIGKGNEEHRIESLLLTEFLKTKSDDKLLCGIQPVTFASFRFPMPTAITASKSILLGGKKGSCGGGIDILARTKGNKITVIELKDENKDNEPVDKVLEQATAYATFIVHLLRSASGEKWYKIFGFNGKLPQKLTIRVCLAMPVKKDGTYEKFDSFKLSCGNDILEYHWIYFEEKNSEIKKIQSSMNTKCEEK